MVSVLAFVGLVVLVVVHTLVAAIATRLLRVRLQTRLGAAVYTVLLVPAILLVSTLAVSGFVGLGPNLGDPGTALFVTVGVPFAIGVTIDHVWMPAPEDVDHPDVR